MKNLKKNELTRKDIVKVVKYYCFVFLTAIIVLSAASTLAINFLGSQGENNVGPETSLNAIEEKYIEGGAKDKVESETFTQYTIRKIEEDEVMSILLKHCMYFLLLCFLNLIISAMLNGVSKFKFGGIEVETATTEDRLIRTLENNTTKMDFVNFLSEEKNSRKIMMAAEEKSFPGYLELLLTQMQEHYDETYEKRFEFNVFRKDELKASYLPRIVKKSTEALKETSVGLSINKESKNALYHRNFQMNRVFDYSIVDQNEKDEYYVILSSRLKEFDYSDGLVVSGLATIAKNLSKETQYLKVVTKLGEVVQEDEIKTKNKQRKR